MRKYYGFTILEALISSVLFFLAISVAVMSFTAGSQHFRGSQDTIKACHNSYVILNMIVAELREADPTSISVLPVNSTVITFTKFHKPTGEIQEVTWELDQANNRVTRNYKVNGSSRTPSTFGDNIMDLRFNGTTKTVLGCKLIRINSMIDVQSEVLAQGAGRRKIIKLAQEAYLRQEQPIVLDIYYISP